MGASERLTRLDLDKPGFLSASHLHRYATAAELCAGKRVLDLGCGIGYGSVIIAERAASVLGVDNDAEAVRLAVDEYGKRELVSFEHADACAKLRATGEGDFDAIVMFEALEHVPDPGPVLDELARLADGGVALLVSVPNSLAFSERNEFHVTDFGFAEARAAFSPFASVQWLYQFLSDGSLLVGEDPTPRSVELVGADAIDRSAANTFIALVGFSPDAMQRASARHNGILAANDNAYMLQLEAANRSLRNANRQLARGIYGTFDAAAGAAVARAKEPDTETQKRIDQLENRAWILKQERDQFLAERDTLRADLERERAWADAGRYHAVDVVVARVKRTPVVAPAARGARWAIRRARRRRTELPGGR